MRLIRVGAAVLNQTPLDWEGNLANVQAALSAARAAGVSVLCLPEMALCGYGCEDAFHSPGLSRTAWEVLHELLPSTRGLIVGLGLPIFFHNAVYNAACLIADGRILGFSAKQHLAGDGLHYEPRWFKPWPAEVCVEFGQGRERYPLGDVWFECGGVRLGFEICEDAWVATRPGAVLAKKGVDILLNPSASHFAFGKGEVRKRFVLEGSRAFGISYIYANLLGNEAGRVVYDGGALIASAGQLLAVGSRFSYAPVQLTHAVIDIDATRMNQARTGSFEPVLTAPPAPALGSDFAFPPLEPADERCCDESWERSDFHKEEEFTRALTLGLFDYMRKSRAHGFVVSLSGGVDSATVSCLVALMVERGVAELGRAGFLARLPAWPDLVRAGDARGLVAELLTCVYQSTDNSGPVTRAAAAGVAASIGATYIEWDVQTQVDGYRGLAEKALGCRLDWVKDDVALQNIQARARAPGVWLLANLKGALLLATSNRSEAAVGYATMDGDTCGGLSPIAGIDKAWLRRYLLWLEKTGPEGLHPIPALGAVNAQAPTAELRPPGAGQTDEADLMPYDVLDVIERASVRDKKTPLEAFLVARSRFPRHPVATLALWVERFFTLWCRNQWKRERYAPSFHVDDANLDPRSWCRFPILSGGYAREIAQLRAWVADPAHQG